MVDAIHMKLTKFLIVLLLILFPFGQLTRIPLAISGVTLYFQDLIITALLFWWLVNHLLKKKPFLKPLLRLPIFAFMGISLFSLLINFGNLEVFELLISFLYFLRWSTHAGIYFVTYEITKNKKQKTDNILKSLAASGVLTGVFGLIQYFLYPNLRNLYYLGWDPHQYRAFGTFLDPGFLGIILVLTLILLLCFKTLKKWIRLSGILVVFLTLLLTYSRSSYLALAIAMIVLAWLKRNLKILLIPVLILFFAVGISILPCQPSEGVKLERTSTISARLENYQQSLKIIKDNLFFGVGFNSLRFVKRDYGFLNQDWQKSHSGAGIDSSLLFVLTTTGVIGLGIYLCIYFLPVILNLLRPASNGMGIQNLYRSRDQACLPADRLGITKKSESLNILITTSIIALLIHSFFLNSLFYPWVMVWMWVILGVNHSESK